MSRIRTTLLVNEEFIRRAHEKGLNISRFLEESLKNFLNGSQQPQQPQLEQPNQTPKELDFKALFPPEALEKLKSLGFKLDNETLRKVLQDSLNSYIFHLQCFNKMYEEMRKTKQTGQPKTTNLIDLFPSGALEKLEKHGFNINDNDWLKRVIKDSLQKTIELGFEVFDPKTGAYVLLE